MPFIDTSSLAPQQPLPGWQGRYFHSESMTFGYYAVEPGAAIHEHAHPNEEVWHVIEGELEVTIDGETRVAGPAAARRDRQRPRRVSATPAPSSRSRRSASARDAR